MKHKIHSFLPPIATFALMLLLTTSCYKDKSSLAVQAIAPIELDTAGISRNLYVEYLDNLVVEPKLADQEGLTFKWEIYESTDDNKTEKTLIGEELVLNYKATLPENNSPYNLLLTITDTRHGDLEKIYKWNLTIQGAITSGLLVAEATEQGNSELSFIKSSNLTTNYKDKPTKILRNLIANTKAGKIKGEINNLIYTYFGQHKGRWRSAAVVWATTTDGQLLQLNHKDMELKADLTSDNIIVYKTAPNIRAEQLFLSAQSLFLRTNVGYYTIEGLGSFTSSIGYFQVPVPELDQLKISNDKLGVNTQDNANVMGLFYNEEAGKIQNIRFNGGLYTLYDYQANSSFDPNALPNRTAVAVANTHDKKGGQLLLKDNATGNYELYTVTHFVKEERHWKTKVIITPEQKPIALKKYTLPAEAKPLLDGAKSIFFASSANLIYVASDQHIYALTYSPLSTEVKYNATPLYTIPAGEVITQAKVLVQGDYAVKDTQWGLSALPWNRQALIVLSQKGEQGTVRIIPMEPEHLAQGTLRSADAETHTGFGRILYVTHIGD